MLVTNLDCDECTGFDGILIRLCGNVKGVVLCAWIKLIAFNAFTNFDNLSIFERSKCSVFCGGSL